VTGGARDVALEVLRRVFTQGAYASILLRTAFARRTDLLPSDRALATELVYGVLRHRGHLDRALSQPKKRLKDLDPRLHDLLRIGAYQLMYLDRIPDHAAVGAAVEQAKARVGARGAGQVNAILRRIASTPPDERLPAPAAIGRDPVRHVAEAGSVPHALAELLVRDLGAEKARDFVLASLQPAPLTLRVNLLKSTRARLIEEVDGEAGDHPRAVRLKAASGTLPAELACVVEGRATPQDEGSMRVVDLLDPQPGERALDVCSAPGGKATYAAERMDDRGEVLAYDRVPVRLSRVADSARRLGLASVRTVDILPRVESSGFDRVLVDAPCTGLGTLRRHPEIRWRFQPAEIERLVAVQREVIAEGASRVRIGGTLVYAVCSITEREGEHQLRDLDGFDRVETLRTFPQDPGAPDGFFAAKLIRKR
jgi:16S rRNA (cytosine967-C5)-methyltransferase